MTIDLEAARQHAARNPESFAHAALLRRLDPSWSPPGTVRAAVPARPPVPSRPLDLTAARAALAARRQEQQRSAVAPARTPAPARPPLDLSQVRTGQDARRVPALTATGTRFTTRDGAWRWVDIQTGVPAARRWEHLAIGLTSASPFVGLRIRPGATGGGFDGRTWFHTSPDTGETWVDMVLDPHTADDTDRVISHELAHVADEAARLQDAGTAAAWRAEFGAPHRSESAEHFAVDAEEWLRPTTSPATLLAHARRTRRAPTTTPGGTS